MHVASSETTTSKRDVPASARRRRGPLGQNTSAGSATFTISHDRRANGAIDSAADNMTPLLALPPNTLTLPAPSRRPIFDTCKCVIRDHRSPHTPLSTEVSCQSRNGAMQPVGQLTLSAAVHVLVSSVDCVTVNMGPDSRNASSVREYDSSRSDGIRVREGQNPGIVDASNSGPTCNKR